jgi:lipopolysaccharide export system protein LptA
VKKSLFVMAALLATTSAFAQTAQSPMPAPVQQTTASPANANSAQPIEITATKTVEWLRDQKQYVARENVVVTQGTMTINADLLTADYRESSQNSMEIWQLTALGNVKIKDENNTASGDKGIYDVPNGVAVLTGENLSLVSPDQTVTATERMEYHANERMAKAVGNAKVVRATDTLNADTITAFFKDNAAPAATPVSTAPASASPIGGGGNLDRLEAEGSVVIRTPTETLHGQKGIYRAGSNTAELIGKVRIERGENVLEGNRAEVNLTTNVSKLFGSGKEGGRVRGVFFPGSEKASTDKPAKPVVPAPFAAAPAQAQAAPTPTPGAMAPVSTSLPAPALPAQRPEISRMQPPDAGTKAPFDAMPGIQAPAPTAPAAQAGSANSPMNAAPVPAKVPPSSEY